MNRMSVSSPFWWLIVSFLVVGSPACTDTVGTSSAPATADASMPTALVERGAHLVEVGLCNDCHTPKKPGPNGPELDMERLLSGHRETELITVPYLAAPGSPWTSASNDSFTAWSGPWGVSFTANLTPDTVTGLRSGVWTEELFIQAMRTGKHMGTSREILPPMPWHSVGKNSDEDLKAIWAYLGSIPPVRNTVPEPLSTTGQPLFIAE